MTGSVLVSGNMSVRARSGRGTLLAMTALGVLGTLVLLPAEARAQEAAKAATSDRAFAFDLPRQPLSRSLAQLSQIGGLQLLYTVDEADKVTAPALSGRMTIDQALARLLAGSGFSYRYLRPGVVTLERAGNGAANGERVLGPVRVEGATGSPYFGRAGQAAGVNGINGSRDITATEGTGSFTSGALTIGSKVPQAMKDVPQSISVLTAERLEQQNVTDFTRAMKQLPGVTLVQGASSLENTFYSRGFAISKIQIDGGAPILTSFADGGSRLGYYPQIDLSQYDHVEILRGADGLFSGYGDPAGTVNLVRKKPLDHAQILLDLQAGSWSNYRTMIDATSPLALDGKLRGRLVLTYEDKRHFYKIAKDNKTVLFGTLELEATPTTLVSTGLSYTRQDSVPFSNGLPRYLNGKDIGLPRSTSLALPWNRWDFDTTEIFGVVEQQIGANWRLKTNVTYNRQSSDQKVGYSAGAVNPFNSRGPFLAGSFATNRTRQASLESVLSGAFELFGQRQEVTVGANRVSSNGDDSLFYGSFINATSANPYQPYPGGPVYCNGATPPCPVGSIRAAGPPVNVFSFNPNSPLYNEPANPLPSSRFVINGRTQTGAYLNLRLTAFDRLHLTTGLRWSKFDYRYSQAQLCTTLTGLCAGKNVGDNRDAVLTVTKYSDTDFSWPPPVNLSFDFNDDITAYVGYTDIYKSQAQYFTADLTPIAPVTGSNWEFGVKWSSPDRKMNLSASAYKIKQKGFGVNIFTGIFVENGIIYVTLPDGRTKPYQPTPFSICCFVSDPQRIYESKGIDIDFTGEISNGWQLAANYTYNQNKQLGSYFNNEGGNGEPAVSISPKHLYKLWTSYDFGAAGHAGFLSGLRLSLGLNGQSSGFRSGTVCVNLLEPNPITGESLCVSNNPPDREKFFFTVPSHVVLSGGVDYRFSDKWSLAVNLENILDKTYYQTVGSSPTSGHWYGAPRSVTATLRAKW